MKWMVNHMVTRSWKHDELMRELPDALKYARIIAYNANHGDYADEFQSDVQRKAFQYLEWRHGCEPLSVIVGLTF